MQKFVNEYNTLFDLTGTEALKIGDVFKWDDVIGAFILNADKFNKYITEYKQKLITELNLSDTEATAYIAKQAQENVNFSSFLSSENRGEGSKARKILLS